MADLEITTAVALERITTWAETMGLVITMGLERTTTTETSVLVAIRTRADLA